MNPQTVLQERYPSADFGPYFAFLEACKGLTPEKGKTHEHHICPKAQFPEYRYELANLITLMIEDHRQSHRLLAAAIPEEFGPPAAWIEGASEAAPKGGRAAAEKNKAKGTSVYSREIQMKGASLGGRVSGRQNKELGRGIFGLTLEQRQEIGRRAGKIGGRLGGLLGAPKMLHNRWHVKRGIVSPTCSLCGAQ